MNQQNLCKKCIKKNCPVKNENDNEPTLECKSFIPEKDKDYQTRLYK